MRSEKPQSEALMNPTTLFRGWATLALTTALLACGDDDMTKEEDKDPVGQGDGDDSADQTPPMGASEVESWLKAGAYKSWHCEPRVHESRSPSPHGFNRICSNDLVADNVDG